MKIISGVILLLFYSLSLARVIDANSGSRNDINNAINEAQTGDTVMIPAGDFSFNGDLSFKAGIIIMGAGQDRTIIRRTGNTSNWMMRIDGSNGERVRITGMTIIGRSPSTSPGIRLSGSCKDFRIDHITFKKCFSRAIEVHGNARGVIDHNIFIDNEYTAVVVYGDESASWNRPLALGTEQAVFVEDNYFEHKNIHNPGMAHHIASNNGSKYVFRYNTVNDGYLNAQAIDAHGNKFGGERGSRSYEIYSNKLTIEHRWLGMCIRGGDGVIFDNEMTGDLTRPIDLMHEGRNGDGNCNYPCVDQIRELYMWGNTYNRKPAPVNVRHTSIIKENRDYFMHKKPGYVPFTYPHPLTEESIPTSVLNKTAVNGNKTLDLKSSINASKVHKIEYSIPENYSNVLVQLNVYNARGQHVRTLVNSVLNSGQHEILWDGLNDNREPLANGIYTLKLNAAKMNKSSSIMLFRK